MDVSPVIPADGRFAAHEPSYSFIPPSALRRMGKLVRMGLGTALPIIKEKQVNAIIMATANAGKEDCVNFLEQVIHYDEGMLTPLHFVQSTPNALGGQLGLFTGNHNYNITHVHLGLAFEYALLDAMLWQQENPGHQVLLGAADDLSPYQELYEAKTKWIKGKQDHIRFLDAETEGSLPGESTSMFLCTTEKQEAFAEIAALDTWHGNDLKELEERILAFIENHHQKDFPLVFFSGQNGDIRLNHFYQVAENCIKPQATLPFKLACGEFPTNSAFGVWMAGECFRQHKWPVNLISRGTVKTTDANILLYNNQKGTDNSLIMLKPVHKN
jgi:hypothetical protein